MTERLTVEMVDELQAREDHEDGSEEYYRLLQLVTSPALIRAALVERDEARAQVATLTQALAEAQARFDALVSERERDAAPAEPSTAEDYATLTEAPSTYEALLNGADAIDARRKGGV